MSVPKRYSSFASSWRRQATASDSTMAQVTPRRVSAQLSVIEIGTPVRQTVPDMLVVVLSTRNQNRTVVPAACHVIITESSSASVQERASKAPECLGRSIHCAPAMAVAVVTFGE